jgi:hypothetical protein
MLSRLVKSFLAIPIMSLVLCVCVDLLTCTAAHTQSLARALCPSLPLPPPQRRGEALRICSTIAVDNNAEHDGVGNLSSINVM